MCKVNRKNFMSLIYVVFPALNINKNVSFLIQSQTLKSKAVGVSVSARDEILLVFDWFITHLCVAFYWGYWHQLKRVYEALWLINRKLIHCFYLLSIGQPRETHRSIRNDREKHTKNNIDTFRKSNFIALRPLRLWECNRPERVSISRKKNLSRISLVAAFYEINYFRLI